MLKHIVVNTLVFDEWLKKGIKQSELMKPLREMGIKKVEVRREYLQSESELEKIKKAAKENQLTILYSVPELLFAEQMIEHKKLKQFFEEAQQMGAKYIKMTGGYANQIRQEDAMFIDTLIKQYEIERFSIENDQSVDYATANQLYQLVNQLTEKGAEVSITFDIGNFIYVHEDPVASARKLSKWVSVIHLKDVKKEPIETTLLGEGDISIQEVISCLPENLDMVMEYPCGNQPIKVLKKELSKLSSLKKERV